MIGRPNRTKQVVLPEPYIPRGPEPERERYPECACREPIRDRKVLGRWSCRRSMVIPDGAPPARVRSTPPTVQAPKEMRRGLTPDQMLDELRDLAFRLGRTPKQSEVRDNRGTPTVRAYAHAFGTWAAACVAAGLTPRHRRGWESAT